MSAFETPPRLATSSSDASWKPRSENTSRAAERIAVRRSAAERRRRAAGGSARVLTGPAYSRRPLVRHTFALMAAAAPKPPAPASRRNNIGTLRLAGALAVLFGHAFVLSSSGGRGHDPISDAVNDVTPFHLGLPGLGVAMFFAISGYLVTQSYVRRGSFVAYAEARLLRIYPALWLAIGLTIAVSALISTFPPGDFLSARPTVDYAIGGASLLDLHYFLPGVFTDNPRAAVNGSLWTLPVELRMYLFVGIAGVIGMLGRRVLFNLALIAIVAVAAIWPEHMPLLAHHEQLEISTFFLAGAVLFVNRERIPLTGIGV